MGAGFAYRNVGILRYSRQHVIGDLQQPASTTLVISDTCFGVTSEAALLRLVRQE